MSRLHVNSVNAAARRLAINGNGQYLAAREDAERVAEKARSRHGIEAEVVPASDLYGWADPGFVVRTPGWTGRGGES